MNIKKMTYISVFCTTLLFIGCENASNTVISIPKVFVACTTTDSAQCSDGNGNGANAFVQMTRSSCSAADFDPVATGNVQLSCDANGCEGTVTSWTNPVTFDSVTEILTGSMDICTTLDLDGSGSTIATSGDLIDDQSKSISSSATIIIEENWDVEP